MITPCTTHEQEGLLELVPEFWGKPRIASLLVGYLTQIQALEDAAWTLIDGLDVSTAERAALEALAVVVGEPARPADDDVLRVLVRARIAANRSDGTLPALADVVRTITDHALCILDDARTVRVLHDGAIAAPDAAAQVLDAACGGGKNAVWVQPAGDETFALPAVKGDLITREIGVGIWSEYHG